MSIEFVANAALAGISPETFLQAETDIELAALILVAEKAIEYQRIQQQNLAVLIINQLGKALGADKKKKSSGVQRNHRGSPQSQGR